MQDCQVISVGRATVPLHTVKLVICHLAPSSLPHHLHLGLPEFCSVTQLHFSDRGPEVGPHYHVEGWPEDKAGWTMKVVCNKDGMWHNRKVIVVIAIVFPLNHTNTQFSVWFLRALKLFTLKIILYWSILAFQIVQNCEALLKYLSVWS